MIVSICAYPSLPAEVKSMFDLAESYSSPGYAVSTRRLFVCFQFSAANVLEWIRYIGLSLQSSCRFCSTSIRLKGRIHASISMAWVDDCFTPSVTDHYDSLTGRSLQHSRFLMYAHWKLMLDERRGVQFADTRYTVAAISDGASEAEIVQAPD
uniref:Uncharacterized protein n=1 Tax=Steinernema glaseri TaxID=37863 RepID=A0A1I7YW44_9BILA